MNRLSIKKRNLHILVFALLLCLCFSGAALSAEVSKDASFKSLFTYRATPQILHENPEVALTLALSEKRQDLVEEMWKFAWNNYPAKQGKMPESPRMVSGLVLDETTALAVFALPKPAKVGEPYYACVLVTFTRVGNNTPVASGVRYFTLENAGTTPAGKAKKSKAKVATTIGEWGKDGQHTTHGAGPSAETPDAFVKQTLEMFVTSDQGNKEFQIKR